MTGFILFFIGYFFLTFTLSKIAEKEEIDGDGLSGFFLLLPPVYFLYITRRFPIMIIVTALTYGLINFLLVQGIPLLAASILFIIPILIGFAYILHNLKASPELNLFNFFPPVLGTVGLLTYLAFGHTPEEKLREMEIEYERDVELKKGKFSELKDKVKQKSDFYGLNKNLFKEFDKIDYQKINNENYLGYN